MVLSQWQGMARLKADYRIQQWDSPQWCLFNEVLLTRVSTYSLASLFLTLLFSLFVCREKRHQASGNC